jgi:hypothetical protein
VSVRTSGAVGSRARAMMRPCWRYEVRAGAEGPSSAGGVTESRTYRIVTLSSRWGHSLHACLPQPMRAQPFSLICADVFKVATVSRSILPHPEQDTAMASEAIAAGAGRAVLRGSGIRLPPERAPARAAADQCGTPARKDPRHTGTAPGSAAPLARPTESASRCRTHCT